MPDVSTSQSTSSAPNAPLSSSSPDSTSEGAAVGVREEDDEPRRGGDGGAGRVADAVAAADSPHVAIAIAHWDLAGRVCPPLVEGGTLRRARLLDVRSAGRLAGLPNLALAAYQFGMVRAGLRVSSISHSFCRTFRKINITPKSRLSYLRSAVRLKIDALV